MEDNSNLPSAPDAPPVRVSARQALLEAAAQLFAEKGAEGVSTREIAARAKVKSGLIHRHFRTKDSLLREVLEGLSEEISSIDTEGEDEDVLLRLFESLRERDSYWRLLARTMLDGLPIEHVQRTFPTMGRAVQLVRGMQEQDKGQAGVDPRVVAAMLGAGALGWLVFERWILQATGFEEDEKDQARAEMVRLARALLDQRAA